MIIVVVISVPLFIKVTNRVHYDYDGELDVTLSDYNLYYAPRGPGWSDEPVSWSEAYSICAHLSEDGTKIMEEPQNYWRLPSVEE